MENKKYKMLAVDMDGTLLDSKKRITEKTLEAIKKGRENGMIFTLSTGRPRPSVIRYLDVIMPDVPAVLYNGGQIYDCKTRECLYKVELDTQDARQVLELADEYDVTAAVWSDEKLYTNRVDEYIGDYKSLSGLEPILIENREELLSQSIMKIILIKDKEKIEELSDMLSGKTIGTATWCTSNPMYLEFFNGETSKGNALRKVAEMCGLTLDEIIAIGDGENDIPMLEIVGRSVAMGNAEQCIKDIADEATLTCDEDGVAAVIEKYFI